MDRRTFMANMAASSTALAVPAWIPGEAMAALGANCPSLNIPMAGRWYALALNFWGAAGDAAVPDTTIPSNPLVGQAADLVDGPSPQSLKSAKAAGATAVVVSLYQLARVDQIPADPANEERKVLTRFQRYCIAAKAKGIQVIPQVMALGGWGGVGSRNEFQQPGGVARNWLEGQKVIGTKFVVAADKKSAVHQPVTIALPNPTDTRDNSPVLSTDTVVKHGASPYAAHWDFRATAPAQQSARIFNFAPVVMVPDRVYVLRFWFKCEGLKGNGSPVSVQVRRKPGHASLASFNSDQNAIVAAQVQTNGAGDTQDWVQVSVPIPSQHLYTDQANTQVAFDIFYVVNGTDGQVWIDDVTLQEAPPAHILRRTGCPVTVKVARTGATLTEGVDYTTFADPDLGKCFLGDTDVPGYSYNRPGNGLAVPAISLTSTGSGKVVAGDALSVGYHQYVAPLQYVDVGTRHPTPIYSGSWFNCQTYSGIDSFVDANMAALKSLLSAAPPTKFFLTWDEIRHMQGCDLCRTSSTDHPAALLSRTYIRYANVIEKYFPGAEVVMWSDMFDPIQNAVPGTNYMGCPQPFSTTASQYSAQLILNAYNAFPKKIKRLPTIMCWPFGVYWNTLTPAQTKAQSLGYFAGKGYKVMAATFYDYSADSDPCDWLSAMASTSAIKSKASGLMYQSWSTPQDFSQLNAMLASYTLK